MTPRGIYAAETTVSVEKSLAELRQILKRYESSGFAYLEDGENQCETVAWKMGGRPYRITISVPHYASNECWFTDTGKRRTEAQAKAYAGQIHRQRWRAVVLVVKAMLEGGEAMGFDPEQLMIPYLVLTDGRTLAELAPEHVPQIQARGWVGLLGAKDE